MIFGYSKAEAEGGVDGPVGRVAVVAGVAVAEVVVVAVGAQIVTSPLVADGQTRVEVPADSVVDVLLAGLHKVVLFHVVADVEVVGADGDAVVERQHRYRHGADEPTPSRYPVESVASTYAGLREFELADVVHQQL